MSTLFDDFMALIYPRTCVACGNSLFKHEDQVCHYCYLHLPKTHFHQQAHNPVKALFDGRVNVQMASSFYLFHKQGHVQKLLHSVKYKGNEALAILIGKWYAEELKEHPSLNKADYIIPVPLHPKKLAQRGYNQSEAFAKGLSEGLHVPVSTTLLQRQLFTATQTRKTKYERWENVEDAFELTNETHFKHCHLVVVDDVITTGATIEACCQLLQTIEGVTLSVLSMAYADK